MTQRLARLFLALASPVMLVTFVSGTTFDERLFAALAMAFPVALITVGASRGGRLGPLAVPLFGLLVVFEVGVVWLFALRGRVLEAPDVFGLPLGLAIQLVGLFLVPLVLTTVVYIRTFDRHGLRAEDLEILRRAHGPSVRPSDED